MDNEQTQWMYLQTIVGNFNETIEYFFVSLHLYAAPFRMAGTGLIFSIGLAWLAVNVIRAPVDRMKSAGVGILMVMAAGFLNSGTTNTNTLGPASGTELSKGGYYTYLAAGTVIGVFNSILTKVWDSQLLEQSGKSKGMTQDAINIAWKSGAERFAETFIKGDGKQAYLDYHIQCGPEAMSSAKTNEELAVLSAVGFGGNTLGLEAADTAKVAQVALQAEQGDAGFSAFSMPLDPAAYAVSQRVAENKKSEAQLFLEEKLENSNSNIDGSKGYRIPTSNYYQKQFDVEGVDPKGAAYLEASSTSTQIAAMRSNGVSESDSTTLNSNVFYPKNCYELYLVADQTMREFREGVKGLPDLENLENAQAFQSMSASRIVRKSLNDQIEEHKKRLGIDGDEQASVAENLGDVTVDLFKSISEKINRWMLEFQIPALVTSMALLVVVLIITFPVFAVLSVIVGPGILISYLKLMFLPFIVVFLNMLFLTLTTTLVSYSVAHDLLVNTFNPGGADSGAAIAAQNLKAIVFTLLTVAELGIAKFILWDDFRAVTSFNAGNASLQQAGAGMKAAATVAAVPIGGGRGAVRMASASAAKGRTQQSTSILSSINKTISHATSRAGTRRPISPVSGPNGTNRTSPGGNPPHKPLVPKKD